MDISITSPDPLIINYLTSFGYDLDTYADARLHYAKEAVRSEQRKLQLIRSNIDSIDSHSVYKISADTELGLTAPILCRELESKRDFHLVELQPGGKQVRLPSLLIQSGRKIKSRTNERGPIFAIGWRVQENLEYAERKSRRLLNQHRRELAEIEQAIAEGLVPLSDEVFVGLVLEKTSMNRKLNEKLDWRIFGF